MEMNKEYRSAILAIPETVEQENEEMIVEGRAIVFDTPTLLWDDGKYKYFEKINSRALDNCDMKDVVFRYNHTDQIMVMARTRKGSLQLINDGQGLNIRAKLFNIQPARDLYELIKVGAVDQMSFVMIVEEDRKTWEGNVCTREVLKIKRIIDVAAVDMGAYGDNTNISARTWVDAEAEARKVLENTEARKRLLKEFF